MHAWEAIQKTIEIIESRLGEEITIEELSENAALSVFYYQRLFSKLVKRPVREYIKLRRLARACEALKNTENRILDIALEYGFGSHEAFTRAFKETYGITPSEYKENIIDLRNFDKPDLLLKYTTVDLGIPLISDGFVLEMNKVALESPINFAGTKRYASIAGLFPNGEVTGVDELGEVWRSFVEIENTIPSKKDGRKIGVAYHDNAAPEGYFPYFVGKEVDEILEDFENWALPAGKYLVCRFEAENFEELVSVALNKAFNFTRKWQNEKGLKMGTFGAEIYYKDTEGTEAGYAYMETWALWLE
ncbi:MAG: AraC family transcriptional regulator [Defluviitaleaceae bacterium]|nr:AraC family transcriptional regulator [Defluviitaleaceae bacterium]